MTDVSSTLLLLLFYLVISQQIFFFSLTATATTEIYTLSLHDALPISANGRKNKCRSNRKFPPRTWERNPRNSIAQDRKSTRLNSSHRCISYAVFCLKKKKNKICHDFNLS